MKPEPSSCGIDTTEDFTYHKDLRSVYTVKESKTEYDPHKYVESIHKIGFVGASVHLIRAAFGAAILLAPFAFSLVGYGVAIATMIFTSVLYVNNLYSLLWVEYQLSKMLKVPNLTFFSVVEMCFDIAPKDLQILSPFLKFFMYLYWIVPSANGIYLIVISNNCNKILNHHFHQEYNFANTTPVVLGIMMVLCLLPRLKFLVPLSVLANILTLLNLCMVGIINMDASQWAENGKLVGDFTKLPQFFAIIVYSIGMTAMVIPLKNEMQNPKDFTTHFGVLDVSFGILTLIIGSFGLVGYLNYGSSVKDNINSNLPDGYWITSIVLISYTLSLCVTYILIFYAYDDSIWNIFLAAKLKGNRYETLCKYCLRVSINMTAYGMAVAIPKFGLFVSIIGTIGILMEVCLPSVLHLLVCRMFLTKPTTLWFLVLNSAVITLSAVIFFMSMKTCISDVIKLCTKI